MLNSKAAMFVESNNAVSTVVFMGYKTFLLNVNYKGTECLYNRVCDVVRPEFFKLVSDVSTQ